MVFESDELLAFASDWAENADDYSISDPEMAEMYIEDARDVRRVASLLASHKDRAALEAAANLDPLTGDELPESFYEFLKAANGPL